MHIIVTSEEFADALNPHLQIIPKRATLPTYEFATTARQLFIGTNPYVCPSSTQRNV